MSTGMAPSRFLTPAERAMAASLFGDAIAYDRVRIRQRRFLPFQPRNTIMAPDGDIWVPPHSPLWRDDYATAAPSLQGLFMHEMTHVWQAQTRGRWYLCLMRHPFCRYRYRLEPGRPLADYGLEQQAEIVRHAFLARIGYDCGQPPRAALEDSLPFAAA